MGQSHDVNLGSRRVMLLPCWLMALPILLLQACGGGGDQPDASPPPPPPPPAATKFVISGEVSAVPLTVIEIVGDTTFDQISPNSEGTFKSPALPPGTYTVKAISSGYVSNPKVKPVTIVAADVSGLQFTLISEGEGLSSDVLDEIDSAPTTVIPDSETILPNGQSLEEFMRLHPLSFSGALPFQKADAHSEAPNETMSLTPEERISLIAAQMIFAARQYACGRTGYTPCLWSSIAVVADPNVPGSIAQSGLNYVFGSSSVKARSTDSCGPSSYGVDCSGFVKLLAAAANITVPAGTGLQSVPDTWNSRLPPEWGVTVERVNDGPVKTGDLVFWSDHVVLADGPAHFLGSQGSSKGTPEECAGNIKPNRGPNSHALSYLEKTKKGPHPHTLALRFVPTSTAIPQDPIPQGTNSVLVGFEAVLSHAGLSIGRDFYITIDGMRAYVVGFGTPPYGNKSSDSFVLEHLALGTHTLGVTLSASPTITEQFTLTALATCAYLKGTDGESKTATINIQGTWSGEMDFVTIENATTKKIPLVIYPADASGGCKR